MLQHLVPFALDLFGHGQLSVQWNPRSFSEKLFLQLGGPQHVLVLRAFPTSELLSQETFVKSHNSPLKTWHKITGMVFGQ